MATFGTLNVFVAEARNMPDHEWHSRQDPYVTLRLSCTSQTHRTRTRREGGRNTSWNQSFSFEVSAAAASSMFLEVKVYDANMMRDRLIGRADVDLRHLANGAGFVQWIKMTDDRGRAAGEIKIEASYSGTGLPQSGYGGVPQYGQNRPFMPPPLQNSHPGGGMYGGPPPAPYGAQPPPLPMGYSGNFPPHGYPPNSGYGGPAPPSHGYGGAPPPYGAAPPMPNHGGYGAPAQYPPPPPPGSASGYGGGYGAPPRPPPTQNYAPSPQVSTFGPPPPGYPR